VARRRLALPGPGPAVTGRRTRPGGWAAAACVAAAAALVTACSPAPATPVAGAVRPPAPAVVPLPPQPVAATAPGTVEQTPQTRFRVRDGVTLPDPDLTPGAVFGDVGTADICDLHYTQGVRQPRFNAKVQSFAAYGLSIHERDTYLVDHLVPISLGGSNATTNLWPQPRSGTRGGLAKDALEVRLRALVCAKKVPLKVAQTAIARDWWAAYVRYMAIDVPAGQSGPQPWQPSAPLKGRYPVTNAGPCPTEGKVGYTESKHIRFTCQAGADGELHWRKRY